MDSIQDRLKRKWKSFKSDVGWEDYLAVILIILGVLGFFEGPIPFVPHLTDLFLGIRSELIGIGITVLIIDNVNEIYRRRAEKARLILQMGSPDNGFAIEAVRQLRVRGWLTDGSLKRANLRAANLIEADLRGANLHGSYMSGADLSRADLIGANLNKADLSGAVLIGTFLNEADLNGVHMYGAEMNGAYLISAELNGADLSRADLSGAILSKTDLSGAKLTYVEGVNSEQLATTKSLYGTLMMDGKIYDPEVHTEIARLRKEAGLDDGNTRPEDIKSLFDLKKQ